MNISTHAIHVTEKVTVDIDTKIDVRDFFRSRPGLFVSNALVRIIPRSAPPWAPSSVELLKHEVSKDSNLDQFWENFATIKPIEPIDFSRMLATLLKRQWNGESGTLSNDGMLEIFRVKEGLNVASPNFIYPVGVYRKNAVTPNTNSEWCVFFCAPAINSSELNLDLKRVSAVYSQE